MSRHTRTLLFRRLLQMCLLSLGMLFPNLCLADECTLSFGPAQSFGAGNAPSAVTAGDFNSDSNRDLAIANNLSNNVSILLGNGDGTFQTANNFAAGNGPSSVAAADFNGD